MHYLLSLSLFILLTATQVVQANTTNNTLAACQSSPKLNECIHTLLTTALAKQDYKQVSDLLKQELVQNNSYTDMRTI